MTVGGRVLKLSLNRMAMIARFRTVFQNGFNIIN